VNTINLSHLIDIAEKPHPESDFDAIFDFDRQYFIDNPDSTQYIRDPFAEEISQFGGHFDKIIVTNLGNGLRTRMPVNIKATGNSRKSKKAFWEL
jgi:hypothetical protein